MTQWQSIGELASRDPASLDDRALIEGQRTLARARQAIEAAEAAFAAVLAQRSRRELGQSGLAQRLGARTPERLIQTVTGVSAASARRLVRVGSLATEEGASREPWLGTVAGGVSGGQVSVEAADVIRAGLGAPSPSVSADALATAAQTLTQLAATLDVDALSTRARAMRDDLDIAGVELREQERRDLRYLRLFQQPDGMTRFTGLLDPESAAVVAGAIDAITSPRRGGPRFVNADDVARAEALERDERTTDQIALDGLVELVQAASEIAPDSLLGHNRPGVRVLVTHRDLDTGTGMGFIEGQVDPICIKTVERHACTNGVVPLLFDQNGRGVDVGREKRRHTRRQRQLIAARDGGCIANCERPPAWSEVHHIVPWSEGGGTSVDHGVLLCRHHHMFIHNSGSRIVLDADGYALLRPGGGDLVRLESRSPSRALQRLLAG